MSYTLEAVIAQQARLERGAAGLARDGQARPVALRQGLGLLPLTDLLFAALDLLHGPGTAADRPWAEFWKLSAALAGWCAAQSRDGLVAYVEADIFGSTGTQAAVVWEGGRVVLGPLRTEFGPKRREDWDAPPALRLSRLREMAINRALRRLGARAGEAVDEFAAVGLDAHRATTEWSAG